MPEAPPVVIIGGGVVGAACAHYLAEAGRRVTILERDRFGAACSHGNCGLLSPSHVLPPAGPGVFAEAMRNLFQKDAPLRVAPRWDPRLWRWLLAFAARCNESAAVEAGRGLGPLLASSRSLYDDLGGTLDCEFEPRGLLIAFREAAAHAGYAKTDALLAERFDLPARRLEGAALREFEPALKPEVAGGWFYEEDAHLRPDALMKSWRAALTDRGVTIREGVSVTGFRVEDGRVRGVQYTSDKGAGEEPASAAVVAAGALTPDFQQALGLYVPVAPGKGYSMTLHLDEHGLDPAAAPRMPLLLPEVRVAVTPHAGGPVRGEDGVRRPAALRLGSIMEFAGYDPSIARRRLALLTRGASRFLNVPAEPPADDHPTGDNRWAGWRPMTPDGVPLIGKVPGGRGQRAENLFVAAGHNMLGLSLAPGTGRLIAELVTGAEPHVDPAPYAPGRFSRG
ncbi:NAD(P)/FAD-dependent oxidoreductase [Alienimonas californiensis]|nr:FAD-dependent oxidoreductase [Alienimonas californiensis]